MILFQKEQWEKAYEDWIKLLQRANAEEEMLGDPKAIWDEAWKQASMICWGIVDESVKVPEQRKEAHDKITFRLLK